MNNLNNLSDDELDELFRQSAEHKQVEFDESAWEKMNSLLDSNQPIPKTNKWLKSSSLLALLLFLASIGLYFSGKNIFNKGNNLISKKGATISNTIKNKGNIGDLKSINLEKESEKVISKEVKVKDTETKEASINNEKSKEVGLANTQSKGLITENTPAKLDKNKANNKSESLRRVVTTTKSLERPVVSKNKNVDLQKDVSNVSNLQISANNQSSETLFKTKKGDKSKADKQTVKSLSSVIDEKQNSGLSKSENTDEPVISQISASGINSKQIKKRAAISPTTQNINEVGNSLTNKLNTEKSENGIGAENIADLNVNNSLRLENLTPNLKYRPYLSKFVVDVHGVDVPKPISKPEEFFRKGLSIRLGYSPDVSTVGSNEITKIGSNLGALLEYRFGKRFVLQAGIIKSKKYYDAYPEQYTWLWGKPASKLLEINAICNMIDIPVNIRYDLVSKGKTKLFVSSGITSYEMKKEQYHYDYEDNSNPNIKRHDWSGKTGMYKSSNLNLALGYEKGLVKGLSMQVEPFVKVPLKSIGFGKVPLITYGLMFSANYQLRNLLKK